jgi:4-hydroxy-3-methylbut-2-enyl diphosphate reductase
MPLYQDIADAVYRWFPSVRMWDTICGATMARQQALRELCKRVDAVVVAGSLRSSNTAHLADIAKGMGLPTFLVETADALPAEAFAYGTVGLTAGASTPEHIIDKIRAVLETGAQTAASGVNYF